MSDQPWLEHHMILHVCRDGVIVGQISFNSEQVASYGYYETVEKGYSGTDFSTVEVWLGPRGEPKDHV